MSAPIRDKRIESPFLDVGPHLLATCLLALLLSASASSGATIADSSGIDASDSLVDTAIVGVYLIDVYDVKFPENELTVDMYLWLKSKNREWQTLEGFEIVNAKEVVKTGAESSFDKEAGVNFCTVKCQAHLKHNWNARAFPFDRHRIEIFIESSQSDTTGTVFLADRKSSDVRKDMDIAAWNMKNFFMKDTIYTWRTSFGDLADSTPESHYSRIVVGFTLERKGLGLGLFLKAFLGLFIAVSLALASLHIAPRNLDPRFGLPVGALFGSFANQYIVNGMLPDAAVLTLVDVLHYVSFACIFSCVIVSLFSLRLADAGKDDASRRLDKRGFRVICSAYVSVVAILVLKSVIFG